MLFDISLYSHHDQYYLIYFVKGLYSIKSMGAILLWYKYCTRFVNLFKCIFHRQISSQILFMFISQETVNRRKKRTVFAKHSNRHSSDNLSSRELLERNRRCMIVVTDASFTLTFYLDTDAVIEDFVPLSKN